MHNLTETGKLNEISKYIDNNGDEITIKKETLKDLPEYLFETHFKNGRIMFKIQYEDGKEPITSTYAYSEKEVQQILEKNKDASINWLYLKNSYSIEESLCFKNKKVSSKFVSVNDKGGNNICLKKYNLKDSRLTLLWTEKRYFENGIEIYSFEYSEDGSCFHIDSVQTYQEDIFAWDFEWENFEYYRNVEPTIPEE
ncbi:hypothetical protein HSX10_13355 [Winogradskyella undariae]|uniref:hypothetical protein n=1 Tax=Winogradskyella undariae TaxID=1285465 RepID=UPI00156A92BC|nr:hypothetical protein [Winogradskyella undariae]NRR92555.1 hypothetical protein [Winogradskyella undariae]